MRRLRDVQLSIAILVVDDCTPGDAERREALQEKLEVAYSSLATEPVAFEVGQLFGGYLHAVICNHRVADVSCLRSGLHHPATSRAISGYVRKAEWPYECICGYGK
jgi:hypothetical protein